MSKEMNDHDRANLAAAQEAVDNFRKRYAEDPEFKAAFDFANAGNAEFLDAATDDDFVGLTWIFHDALHMEVEKAMSMASMLTEYLGFHR